MADYAILIDTRFCTGCNTCFYKCVQENRLHEVGARGFARTTVYIKDEGLYHHRCMHCVEPSCAAACPSEALHKTAEGLVLYDAAVCIGCKSCVVACPFNIPQWDEVKKEIVKCTMCAHRILTKEGGQPQPACVEACPTGALTFGAYQEIVAAARRMVEEGKLHLYGLEENGGTSLIVLTKEQPVAVGYPDVPKGAGKGRGVKSVVGAAVVAALVYAGIKKYSERRAQLESQNSDS